MKNKYKIKEYIGNAIHIALLLWLVWIIGHIVYALLKYYHVTYYLRFWQY